MASGLYGIHNSNRSENDHWGKNCFNSSFPTATACYMLEHNIPAVYVHLDKNLHVVADVIPIQEVFNCKGKEPKDLYFSFETVYQPYQEYCFDFIDGIDLVVKDVRGHYLQPLEVKLTVLPTDNTSHKPEEEWGCELVIRSATTSYCALGMFDGVKDQSKHVREIFEQASEASPYNIYYDAPDKSLGIIATGIAFNYLSENYPDGFKHPVLKIAQYPVPTEKLVRLVDECDEILVLEEGYPVVEQQLKGLLSKGLKVHGRLDGTLQRDGELTPDAVGKALGLTITQYYATPEVVEQRPPALCQGCGHRDMYQALNEVLAEYEGAKVFGDIGCYTLGALPPFRAIDTCIDMGASITMAKGASDAGVFPAVSVIGDSTFTHSGMTGLLDCVNENTNITIVISDNETTAMNGGQDSAGTGRLESICAGIGVDPAHLRVMIPLKKNYEERKQIIREEIEYKGVSVLIPRRECIQTLTRKKKASKK